LEVLDYYGVWVSQPLGVYWQANATYRVKPAPTKPRECWSYGAHIRDTEAEAIAFRQAVADAHPGKGYENGPITKWVEVLP
jgi:hypothetical protein